MLAVIVIQILLIMLYLIAFTATQMYIEEVIILMLSAIVVIQGELLIKPD